MRSALIVAGGRSTRFGDEDKALAALAGTPMVRRVADCVADVVDRLVVNCRADQASAIREAMTGYPLPVTCAEDETPDQGPMAGIRTGLRAVETEYAFVVACDCPFVEPAFVEHLFDRAAGHDAAIPRLDDGWYQTTYAVYRAESMAAACEQALARDERRIVAPLDDLDYVVVEEDEVRQVASTDTFESLDTRAEFEAAADRF